MEIPNSQSFTFDEVGRAWVLAGSTTAWADIVPRRCQGAQEPATVTNKSENPQGD